MSYYSGRESEGSWGGGAREPGARRKKLAGYLKAANELRQSYQQSYGQGWGNSREVMPDDETEEMPGAFGDAAVVRSGDEEMILFPSYAKRHVKSKPKAEPGTIQQASGDGRDVRDTTGAGDAEFWQQQWDQYEDDHAVIDVDIRGWLYCPHRGQMNRKHRLFVGLARQLVGVPAPSADASSTGASEMSTPPRRGSPPHSMRERAHARAARKEEDAVAQEAETILRKGEAEAGVAQLGGYSENPRQDTDNLSSYSRGSSADSLHNSSRTPLRSMRSGDSLRSQDGPVINPIQRRESWNQPANMSQAELTTANKHLLTRLKPFLANPLPDTPISAFFYNDEISKQRTIYTNAYGHFTLRAALDFVPTHVRILASEKLSAEAEVRITESTGVSVISDIDDTLKHTDIGSGAREIFRNAFIRNLEDLTIDGVRDWYTSMANNGVKFHYVSNSPWQLYPVVKRFFALAGLPDGSFHLKQYSGMLQGIFEPVAERKKATLDKLARDFPERKFILIGDSGEADLEVYTDFVLENPGRVLAVYIRDITTPAKSTGFFDPSVNPLSGAEKTSANSTNGAPLQRTQSAQPALDREEDDDPHLRAAIEASLRDMERENARLESARRSPYSQPRISSDDPSSRPGLPPRRSDPPTGNLIDIDSEPASTTISRSATDPTSAPPPPKPKAPVPPRKPVSLRAPAPPTPSKPHTLRGAANGNGNGDGKLNPSNPSPLQKSESTTQLRKEPPAPPPPRRTASPAVSTGSAGSITNTAGSVKGPPPPPPSSTRPPGYAAAARQRITNAYNSLPSVGGYWQQEDGGNVNENQGGDTAFPPPRRTGTGATTTSGYSATGGGGTQMNQKEEMWRRRWQRAREILEKKGVVLRAWRIGTDVEEECLKLVNESLQEQERNGGRH